MDQAKMMERSIDNLRSENDQLRDRLAHMESERINIISEKERRERDCKNMQSEINRFNQIINSYKAMQSNNEYNYIKYNEQ